MIATESDCWATIVKSINFSFLYFHPFKVGTSPQLEEESEHELEKKTRKGHLVEQSQWCCKGLSDAVENQFCKPKLTAQFRHKTISAFVIFIQNVIFIFMRFRLCTWQIEYWALNKFPEKIYFRYSQRTHTKNVFLCSIFSSDRSSYSVNGLL